MQIQRNEPWPMPDDCDIAAFMEALRVSDSALHQTEMETAGLSPVPVILYMDELIPASETLLRTRWSEACDAAIARLSEQVPPVVPDDRLVGKTTQEIYDILTLAPDECLPDLGEPDDDCLWWAPDDADVTPC